MKKLLLVAVPALIFSISNFAIAGAGHKYSVGEPADSGADRVIHVSMLDTMRFVFSPEFDEIHDGEIIEFVLKNEGTIVHEFSVGNAEDQIKHAEMMKSMPNMKHEDATTVSLKPGETGKLIWRFKGKDTVVFACNEVGHFDAGMRHDLKISKSH